MPPQRPLYIDECLSPVLASWLRQRGRNAKACNDLGNQSLTDSQVIPTVLKQLGEDVVFVTFDNSLAQEHAALVASTSVTVAVVAPYDARADVWQTYSKLAPQECWKRDIVQRWAHTMQAQEPGTVRRYALSGYGDWTPPRAKPSQRRADEDDDSALAA